MSKSGFPYIFKVIKRSLCNESAIKTALFNYHVEQGGKMVDFAGYMLPIMYKSDSIINSHLHTRQHCSLFDVSHMLQTKIHGRDRNEFMERLTPVDLKNLKPDSSSLTVFTDEISGGILDDLIVTSTSEGYLYVVSNAGRKLHDTHLLKVTAEKMKSKKKDVELEFLDTSDVSLLALQGPQAAAALQPLIRQQLDQLPFMCSTLATIGGVENCRVTRCGYTGEDGFEISVKNSSVIGLVARLMQSNHVKVKLAGLGARDSLRLEAGLCLYGNDINEKTTPVEAALSWLIPKSRRARKDFPGASVICQQLEQGVNCKRVGIKFDGGPPARPGCEVLESKGTNKIGVVTSGGPSPSLGFNIAMGYVDFKHSKVNTPVQVMVRGKIYGATVVKMPFVPTKYYNLS